MGNTLSNIMALRDLNAPRPRAVSLQMQTLAAARQRWRHVTTASGSPGQDILHIESKPG